MKIKIIITLSLFNNNSIFILVYILIKIKFYFLIILRIHSQIDMMCWKEFNKKNLTVDVTISITRIKK